MGSRLHGVVVVAGIFGLCALAGAVVAGCSGVSPFQATQFANTIAGIEGGPSHGGTDGGDEGEDQTTTGAISSVCDIDATLRGISVTVANGSQQELKFAITFAVSAGPGGFVCDEELQRYLSAGYQDALTPGSGNTVVIGCDTLTLLSGTRLLTLEFISDESGIPTMEPATGEGTSLTPTTYSLRRRDSGSTVIPLPEIMVFGTDDPSFTCVGGGSVGDLCTQRGFVYYSPATNLPTGKPVEVQRVQGTVCNSGLGTAPEWRLDKTVEDTQIQLYQYAAGGAIVVTVLDRSGDGPTVFRNQAVWQVTDGNGATVHYPQP